MAYDDPKKEEEDIEQEDMNEEDDAEEILEESVDENLVLISKLLEEGNLLIGTDLVMKALKAGTLSKIFVTKNAPAKLVDDITRYAGLASVELISLALDNVELGTYCRKVFAISIAGMKK